MEEKIKEIISTYTRIPADQINASTIIDRSAVNSSIMLHRMYAKLAEQGFVIQDYWDVKNFGNLLQHINGNSNGYAESTSAVAVRPTTTYYPQSSEPNSMGIGIDIEEIDAMPRTNDFREEEFYKMNFSPSEIAYSILQPEPYASFAGLFAAKEAIVKADNNYKSKTFNMIAIEHEETGKPFHQDFHLSISHTRNNVVAVAIKLQSNLFPNQSALPNLALTKAARKTAFPFWLFLISLVLSLVAIYIASKK